MKRSVSPVLGLVLALSLAAAPPSRADIKPLAPGSQYGGDIQSAASLLQAKKIVSLGEALARVPKYAQGQLLQVVFHEKSDEGGGRAAYEVYVLAEDGLIWEVVLDAVSGEVVQQHPEGAPAKP
jgi:uncharacterized membrane protein YkoI